jgi:hypothetical protein
LLVLGDSPADIIKINTPRCNFIQDVSVLDTTL